MTIAISDQGTTFLDQFPISSLQIRTLILCGLVGVLDGNDTQIIGIAAPSIAAAFHVAPSAMGWAISGSWVGAAVGAVVLGSIADRVGRKPVLIGAVLLFGFFTLLTPFAENFPMLVGFRVLTGIGLGGATPCFLALASDYTPARRRASMVSLVWAAFPLGILIGGLSNGWMLHRFSWHFAFYVGGAIPLLLGLLLLLLIPESIGFLLIRRPQDPATARIVAAIAPGIPITPSVIIGKYTAQQSTTSLSNLFRSGRARATICLWLILFTCFGTTASMAWLPTVLQQSGASPAAAAVAASFLGLGALFGMAIAGKMVDLFGLNLALVGPLLFGAAATVAIGLWPSSLQAASVFVTLVGALVGIGASGGISMVGLIYPTEMRSTGAGWAMGLGRTGQVIVPGLFAILLHEGWTAQGIFGALGVIPVFAAGAVVLLAGVLTANKHEGSHHSQSLPPSLTS